MGTHPIFESDFDCLTEKHNNMAEPKIFAAEEDCRTNWTDSMADYNEADTHLAIEGKPVMERWETPFMNKLADIAASNGGKCLEVSAWLSQPPSSRKMTSPTTTSSSAM